MAIEKRDDFLAALAEYERQFREVRGRDPATIKELRAFLTRRRKKSGTPYLKSLRGLSF